MKRFITLSLLIVFLFSLCSCASKTTTKENKKEEYTENPVVTMYLSNQMKITVELYPAIAPKTVRNFLNLVESDFYNNTIFHRIIVNFMIQGGGFYIDSNNTLKQKSASTIEGEFESNGFSNNLKHEVGVISMARATDPNSASSQFFICSANSPHLDGNYAAFGKCVDQESIDNVIALSKVETIAISSLFTDFPKDPVSIIRVERVK